MKLRRWRNIYHVNGLQKKYGLGTLILDKIDFKTKTVTRDKEGHYIIIKETIQQEDIAIVNIYAPNMKTPKYIIHKTVNNTHEKTN